MRGQNKRMRGRGGGGNNRKPPNPLTRSYESNGPDVKVRGTAAHVAEKYQQLARDAQASGDRVAAENYLQHAEHYLRIIAAAQAQQQAAQQESGGEQPGRRDNDQRERGNRRDDNKGSDEKAASEASGNQPQPANGSDGGDGDDMGLPAFLRNATRPPEQADEGNDAASSGEEDEAEQKPKPARRRRRTPASDRDKQAAESSGEEERAVRSEPTSGPVPETADNA